MNKYTFSVIFLDDNMQRWNFDITVEALSLIEAKEMANDIFLEMIEDFVVVYNTYDDYFENKPHHMKLSHIEGRANPFGPANRPD